MFPGHAVNNSGPANVKDGRGPYLRDKTMNTKTSTTIYEVAHPEAGAPFG